MLDGMAIYGRQPEQGIIRGQQFCILPILNMVLDYPKSWVIIIGHDVLLGAYPGLSRALLPDHGRDLGNNKSVTPEARPAQGRVGNQRLTQDQAFSGSGFKRLHWATPTG